MVKYQQTNKNVSSGNTKLRAFTSIALMTMAPKVGHIYIVHNYTGQYCEQVLLGEFQLGVALPESLHLTAVHLVNWIRLKCQQF